MKAESWSRRVSFSLNRIYSAKLVGVCLGFLLNLVWQPAVPQPTKIYHNHIFSSCLRVSYAWMFLCINISLPTGRLVSHLGIFFRLPCRRNAGRYLWFRWYGRRTFEKQMWLLQSLFFSHFNRKCLIGSKQPDHMKGTLDRYLGGDLNSGVLSDVVIIVKYKAANGIWQIHSIRSSSLFSWFTEGRSQQSELRSNFFLFRCCYVWKQTLQSKTQREIHFFSESLATSDPSRVNKVLFNSRPGLSSSSSKLRRNSCTSFQTDHSSEFSSRKLLVQSQYY